MPVLLETFCIDQSQTTGAKGPCTTTSSCHQVGLSDSNVHCCTVQDGLYVDTGSGFPNAANVSESSDPNGFTAFSHTDLQNNTDLQAAAGQKCTTKGSKHEDLVETCKEATTSTTQCCVDLKGSPLAEVSLILRMPLN